MLYLTWPCVLHSNGVGICNSEKLDTKVTDRRTLSRAIPTLTMRFLICLLIREGCICCITHPILSTKHFCLSNTSWKWGPVHNTLAMMYPFISLYSSNFQSQGWPYKRRMYSLPVSSSSRLNCSLSIITRRGTQVSKTLLRFTDSLCSGAQYNKPVTFIFKATCL